MKAKSEIDHIIEVSNCQGCPFVNVDNEYGYDMCHLTEIRLEKWGELPDDKRHDECPLNNGKVIVEGK